MLYPSRESGIQYKGIRSAPYMIRFISTFMNPIKRINNDEQVVELLKSYDVGKILIFFLKLDFVLIIFFKIIICRL